MGKIGVGIGEDFPVGDPDDKRDQSASSEAGETAQAGPSEDDDRAEFERWKWHRDGERAWAEDVKNQRAEWDAKKRAFKDKIRAAVLDAAGDKDNWRRHSWGYTWRPQYCPVGAFGLGIVAAILAVPILVIVILIALITAAISAPLAVLAILGILIFVSIAHHRHHHHAHYAGRYRYYYDSDIETPPRSQRARKPSSNGETIVTPPPDEEH